jgi:phosphatidylglycerol:prolipoprotein diacylglycerol transferase
VSPELGEGTFAVPAYLALLMAGFLAATTYLRREGERRGLDGRALVDLALVGLGLGVVGARAMAVLTDGKLADFIHLCTDPARVDAIETTVRLCGSDVECGPGYLCDASARAAVIAGVRRTMCYPTRDCLAVFKFWEGGLTFLGGALVALPAGLWLARRRGLPVRLVADLASPGVMLGLAIGKVGCFLEGCCYGAPTSGPLGVRFPGRTEPVHPAQLYESAGALILFIVLHVVQRRTRRPSAPLGWMLALYGAWRFAVELLRGDPRGSLGPLSTAQVVSIPITALGIGVLVWSRRIVAPARAGGA